jgi:hypothetical protein
MSVSKHVPFESGETELFFSKHRDSFIHEKSERSCDSDRNLSSASATASVIQSENSLQADSNEKQKREELRLLLRRLDSLYAK